MDVAFQQMIDRCETELYVQVDADMLLEPWAIRRLVEEIDKRPPGVAMYVGWLWGDAEDRPIQGVKIYRHAITKQFPYRASLSCEVPQIEAMKAAGYYVAVQPLPNTKAACFGLHFALQSPKIAFCRWQRLMQKHRRFPYMGWLATYPGKLLERWRSEPTEVNYAAFTGAIAGLVGELPPNEETDYRKPADDYRRIMSYTGDWRRGPRALNAYVNDDCNLKCPMCRRQQGGGSPAGGIMSEGVLRQILNTFPSIQGVCLAGFGEPLLHNWLGDLVSVCKERGKYCGIITNGLLLKKRADEIEAWAPGKLTVSLNAATADDHSLATGLPGAWDVVLDGIRRMTGGGKVPTGICFICTKQNVTTLPTLLALAVDLRVKFVELVNLLPHGNTRDEGFLQSVLVASDDAVKESLSAAHNAPGSELVTCWPTLIDPDGHCPRKCDSPFVTMGVDGRGNITGCRRIQPPNVQNGHFSNTDVWFNPHYMGLRQGMVSDCPLPDECFHCFGSWSQ